MAADSNDEYGILSVPDERVMTSLPAPPTSHKAYFQLSLPKHNPNIVRKAYPLPKSMFQTESPLTSDFLSSQQVLMLPTTEKKVNISMGVNGEPSINTNIYI